MTIVNEHSRECERSAVLSDAMLYLIGPLACAQPERP
jgi:hypothetical protein